MKMLSRLKYAFPSLLSFLKEVKIVKAERWSRLELLVFHLQMSDNPLFT